jgi:hypothetical protein
MFTVGTKSREECEMRATFDLNKKDRKGTKRVSGEVVHNNKKTIWIRYIKKTKSGETSSVIKRHKKKNNVQIQK